jgi:hypothetical protein
MDFVICAAHIHPIWSLLDETPGMFSIRPFLCRVKSQIYWVTKSIGLRVGIAA